MKQAKRISSSEGAHQPRRLFDSVTQAMPKVPNSMLGWKWMGSITVEVHCGLRSRSLHAVSKSAFPRARAYLPHINL